MHALIQRLSLVKQTRIAARFSQAVQMQGPRHNTRRHVQGVEGDKDTTEPIIESGTPRLRMAASLNKRKHREKHNRIILEGWRLIREALMAKARVLSIFYSDPELLDHFETSNLPNNCLAQVSQETMETISNAVTPPGIVGMFKRPRQGEGGELKSKNSPQNPLTVLCDGLKDPTNLGTLVRICAAAGCQSFITSTGCVDVWEPKVLRCAAGGHFYVPIHYNLHWEEIETLIKDKRIFLADNNTPGELNIPSLKYFQVDWTQGPSVLVIGGETSGLGETVKNLACQYGGQVVHVPMANTIDSISAGMAGTVVVYEAYRQQIMKQNNHETTDELT